MANVKCGFRQPLVKRDGPEEVDQQIIFRDVLSEHLTALPNAEVREVCLLELKPFHDSLLGHVDLVQQVVCLIDEILLVAEPIECLSAIWTAHRVTRLRTRIGRNEQSIDRGQFGLQGRNQRQLIGNQGG